MAEVSRVSVGGRPLTLQDVVLVAMNDVVVNLEPLILDDVFKNENKEKGAMLEDVSIASTEDHRPEELLSSSIVRATLFVRIARLMMAKIPIDSDSALHYLAAAMVGKGFCTVNGVKRMSLAEALTEQKIDTPGLTNFEAQVLLRGTTITAAVNAITAYTSKILMNMADTVAALTVEALGASDIPFEEQFNEHTRAHKGQSQCANNLRVLLDGSKVVKQTKLPYVDVDSVRCIPQYHGPVREVIDQAIQVATVEINSAEPPLELVDGRPSRKCPGGFHPMPVSAALFEMAELLNVLAFTSRQRSTQTVLFSETYGLPKNLAAPVKVAEGETAPAPSDFTGILSLYNSVDADLDFLRKQAAELPHYLISNENTKEFTDLHTDSIRIANAAFTACLKIHKILAMETVAAFQALSIREAILAEKVQATLKVQAASKGGVKKIPQSTLSMGKGTKSFRDRLGYGNQIPSITDDESLSTNFNHVSTVLDFTNLTFGQWLGEVLSAASQLKKPKLPKGTKDYMPRQMVIREMAFNIITTVFKRHGGVTIDTPVFELKDTLMGKYGEDSKLIYDLADQGGEILSLRYDLTVPFARFLALNQVGNIKRYHIARVYRRDQPQMNRGRYREFYQCDFDIAGTYGLMIPDAEVLKILCEILEELNIGNFEVKLNHRKFLDAALHVCGVPPEKFRAICSSIDKLDKEPWEKVRAEMINDKGLSEAVADRIRRILDMTGAEGDQGKAQGFRLIEQIEADVEQTGLALNGDAQLALAELKVLFEYLDALSVLNHIKFDLSLARGLDYYTGVIYEAVMIAGGKDGPQVGSIAAGGRYDKLVGIFSSKEIPAVGVSIGIERVFSLLEAKLKENQVREVETEVFVVSVGGYTKERFKLCDELWARGIKTEMMQTDKPKPDNQFKAASEAGVPYAITIGGDEIAAGVVKLKDMATRTETTVPRSEIVDMLVTKVHALRASADTGIKKLMKDDLPSTA